MSSTDLSTVFVETFLAFRNIINIF